MAAIIIYNDFGHTPPQKKEYLTVSIVSPSISHEVMGPDAMILVMVTAAMKLKDAYSLEEKLWPT